MKLIHILFPIIFLLSSCSSPVTAPKSTELYVMSSGGFTAAYLILKTEYEQETGIKLITSFGASSGGATDSIPERLKRGERADVVILSKNGLSALLKNDYILTGSNTDLARSLIGMAVKEGENIPKIKTPEDFILALKNAKSIGYSASASGTYLSGVLFPKLGIWQDIKSKSIRVVSERVGTVIARGDVEIGFQQISEILPIKGLTFAGSIPKEFQKITIFSTAITKNGQKKEAQKLINFLSSAKATKTINATGMVAIITP